MATSSQSAHASNDSALVASLYDLSNKSPKLVKSTAYFTSLDASDARNVEIRSWKMNEYKYSVTPCPFPTLARGFFTREVREGREDGGSTSRGMSKFLSSVSQPRGKEKAQEKKYQIVARGYDKFFNIDEVPWTSVSSFFKCVFHMIESLVAACVVGSDRSQHLPALYALPQI
ncbi:hypothetical protein CPB83DRAFT_862662 [Crepidotus variabilis]|uniref:T4 RNA ligase 1-like N-terminal domain-containing protein n=1 Tax=Crepidotus variabilis TaxID=179855 RepID=A0A9P6E6I0_9AGAR|nr:hypothetical protein CPB83DRAFT_862662 [Crepidotus variabilis]